MKWGKIAVISVLAAVLAWSVSFSTSQASWKEPDRHGWKNDRGVRGWIMAKMKKMTLEEKVGQLFMVQVYGRTPTDPDYEATNLQEHRGGKNFAEVIQKYHIGGVIYFNWNANIGTPVDPVQVNALSNGIQHIAMDARVPIPLFIATDQEGGIVARVQEPGTVFPGNMALGATRSVDAAAKTANIMGKELKSLGINMDLAPDMDVNVNPENPVIGVRSFSEDPDLVSKMGVAQVKAYQKENVLATAKHFPGHGDTNVDSHYGLPIIHHDLKTLNTIDLKPFKAAIRAGIDAIMTAHIVVPALDDSGLPATLSKPILTGLLRHKLGFEGLIITDSLGMSGANVLPPDRIPVEAFKAGADILLNPPDVDLTYHAVLNAVKSGEISKQRLDASVYRILYAKWKRGLFKHPYTDPNAVNRIGLPENLATADGITNKSLTLVKNDHHLLPFQRGERIFVTGPSAAKPDVLSNLLNAKGLTTSAYPTATSPNAAEIAQVAERARSADAVLVTTYTANTNSAQQRLVQALLATGKPVAVASMRNPYDIAAFPAVDANILTYGNLDVSVCALARALAGEVNPSGKLPVTIPGQYSFGHGLSY